MKSKSSLPKIGIQDQLDDKQKGLYQKFQERLYVQKDSTKNLGGASPVGSPSYANFGNAASGKEVVEMKNEITCLKDQITSMRDEMEGLRSVIKDSIKEAFKESQGKGFSRQKQSIKDLKRIDTTEKPQNEL